MQVTVTRHVDASEPDASGAYDYRYEYDLIRVADGDVTVVARSYTSSPAEAFLLHLEFSGQESPVCDAYLKLPLVTAAIAHLKDSGKKKVVWRGPEGYEPVPTSA